MTGIDQLYTHRTQIATPQHAEIYHGYLHHRVKTELFSVLQRSHFASKQIFGVPVAIRPRRSNTAHSNLQLRLLNVDLTGHREGWPIHKSEEHGTFGHTQLVGAGVDGEVDGFGVVRSNYVMTVEIDVNFTTQWIGVGLGGTKRDAVLAGVENVD